MMGFRDAVASAGPYANNLHVAPDRQPQQHPITHVFHISYFALCPTVLKSQRRLYVKPAGRMKRGVHNAVTSQ